jgi:hypothetical protein
MRRTHRNKIVKARELSRANELLTVEENQQGEGDQGEGGQGEGQNENHNDADE